jgi:hypothetical protein
MEGEHPLECECRPISPDDLMEFDTECGCERFGDKTEHPEELVYEKVNKQID